MLVSSWMSLIVPAQLLAAAPSLEGSDSMAAFVEELLPMCVEAAGTEVVSGGTTAGLNAMREGDQQVAPMTSTLPAKQVKRARRAGSQPQGWALGHEAVAVVQSRREAAPGQCDVDGDGVCSESCPSSSEPARYGCRDRQNRDQECIGVAFTNRRVKDGDQSCSTDDECTLGGTRPDRFCSQDVPPSQRPDPNLGVCSKRRYFKVKEKNGRNNLQCPGCTDFNGDGNLDYELEDGFDALRVLYFGVHHDGRQNCSSDVRHTLADQWASFSRKSCQDRRCLAIRHLWRRADDAALTAELRAGLSVGAGVSFCNGRDNRDNDPIRRSCEDGEQVCGTDGTLGLVLPIVVPSGVAGNLRFNRQPCEAGNFAQIPGRRGARAIAPRDAQDRFGCLNTADNRAPDWPDVDGRAYNLVAFQPDGQVLVDSTGREITSAYYRIHTDATMIQAGDAIACRRGDATRQIGCLVQAAPCSLGIAGSSAIKVSGSTNLKLAHVRPTIDNIRRAQDDPDDYQAYPITTEFSLQSLLGFDNLDAGQDAIAACFFSNDLVETAAAKTGMAHRLVGGELYSYDENGDPVRSGG